MAVLAADPSAALKLPAGTPVAARVKAQLARDYPPGALSWVDSLASWTGPLNVPASQIDRTRGTTDWKAAEADKAKLQLFRKKIASGFRKPVVLVRTPGGGRLFAVDGHSRILASEALGLPVAAWVGTAKTATGPWLQTHARQLSNDLAALELSAAGYPAGTVKPRSGMISLDLPDGTIKPVPGGTDSHHITVVYLGPDVDDAAFTAACARAETAAAAMSGPLAGTVGGIGSFPPSDSSEGKRPAFAKVSLPGAAPLRSALEDLSASEHAQWKPHVTLAYRGTDEPLPPPVPRTPVKFTHLSVHRGDDVKQFPLGGTELAGDAEAVELSAQTPVLSTAHHPFGSPSGPGLFKVKGLQLPAYIQNIAHALVRSGHAESQAIQLAIGAVQRWARGGGKVSPEVRAAAAAAIAQWNAAKATAHSHANEGGAVIELGTWNEALHPRVGAGASAGGQFTKGQQGQQVAPAKGARKPPARRPGAKVQPRRPPQRKPMPAPHPDHHVLTGAQAAKAHQLRAQANQYRTRADEIRKAIRQQVQAIHAAVTTQRAAKAASAKATAKAKTAAKKPVKARKTPAKPRKKTAVHHHATIATRAAHIGRMRSHVATMRAQARALDREANKLDRQAAAL